MPGSSLGGVPDRVARICAAATDSRTLRLDVLAELRSSVGFDAYAWLLTDPETTVGSGPLADVPCLPELPRLIRLKYLTEVNRWTALPRAGVATLATVTGADLSRSRVWRELLACYGVTDVASLVFWDRFGCWSFLELWRIEAAPFTPADARALATIVPDVTTALRRCQAVTFTPRSAEAEVLSGPVVLLLSAELDLLAQTPETESYLRVLVPPEDGRAPVPSGAYNVAAQLLAVEAGVDGHPPKARVHLASGRWLALRAARISDDSARIGTIAVTIEEASALERLSMFARASGLTPRETELLQHLVTGIDTRELAGRLSVSEHTVQDHLKAIFTKTSTAPAEP